MEKNQYIFKNDPKNKGEKVPIPRAKNGEDLTPEQKKFLAKYTQLDSGSTPMGGWSNTGMQKFDTLCKTIKNKRAEPTYREAEQEVLPHVRQLDQVQATTEVEFLNSNQRVLTNAAPLPVKIVFEEEV